MTDLVTDAGARGHAPHVVCLRRAGQLASELSRDLYTVQSKSFRGSMLAPLGLARTLCALTPDVVHLHSGVWYKGAYACRLAGIRPVVFTDHGRPRPDGVVQRSLDGLGARMTDRVVAVSAPLAEYLATRLHVRRDRLEVIPNGIRMPPPVALADVEKLRSDLRIAPGVPVVGAIGRLDPIKAYDLLLSAFAMLRVSLGISSGGPVLVIVGDGPEREVLERRAVELNLGESVRFVGWRHDIPQLLGLMDVFVLSSDSEGTSLSLLEAMASGTAVVATAVGGTPDVIGPSGAGTLVQPRDAGVLAGAIQALLVDPEQRREMGRLGRARVQQAYSFEAMATSYQDCYDRLLASSAGEAGAARNAPVG